MLPPLHRCLAVCAVFLWLAPTGVMAAEAGPSASGQLLRLILGLVVVLVAVFLLSRLLPRLGGRALTGGRGFRIVASLPVGQRERVVLLEIGERQIMLGVAPGRVSTLHVLEQPIVRSGTAAGEDSQAQTWLARALSGRVS